MKNAGYALVFLAVLQAIALNIVGPDTTWLLASFGVCFVLGSLILVVTAVRRLVSGDLNLRPVAALKRMPVYLLLFTTLTLTLHFVFRSTDKSLLEQAILAVVLTVFFAFYSTVYRKPE